MFRSHLSDMAGVPGMFGDGLMHWHSVSRALATHWYHVSVQRFHDGQFRNYTEMPNDEAQLVELLLAQDQNLLVQEVQVMTPAWMNKGAGWKLENLNSLAMGFNQAEVPICVLEVESGEVYVDSHEPLDVGSLTGLKVLYRRSPVKADSAEKAGA